MTAASRSLATALWEARFASGLLPQSYTTTRDTTRHHPPSGNFGHRSLSYSGRPCLPVLPATKVNAVQLYGIDRE